MASSYLTLYGNYEKKTWDRNSNVWRSPVDQASQVVHDKLNNVYYGVHSQADTVKYLTQAIGQSQQLVNATHGFRDVRNARGYRKERYAYSAAEKSQHQQQLANQQKYLSNINNGGYRQEANTFFDSYDAYTQDYNNIYQRNYNNTEQEKRNTKIRADNARKQKEYEAAVERNRLQAIENDKTAARNQKIKGEEEALEQNKSTGLNKKNRSRAKPIKPNLTIGTGLAGSAYQGIFNSGLSL